MHNYRDERNIICNNSLIDKQNVLSEFIYHAVSKGSFYPDELSVGFRTYCVKTSLIANKIAELAEQYLAFEAKVKSEDESKLVISNELEKLFDTDERNLTVDKKTIKYGFVEDVSDNSIEINGKQVDLISFNCQVDKKDKEINEVLKEAMAELKFVGLTTGGEEMTWTEDGEPSKAPKAVIIENGAYKAL